VSVETHDGFDQTVDVLKRDHLEAARAAVKGEELREELVAEIEADCEGLRAFLAAAQVSERCKRLSDPKSLGAISSRGPSMAE
jgi:aspartate kinase